MRVLTKRKTDWFSRILGCWRSDIAMAVFVVVAVASTIARGRAIDHSLSLSPLAQEPESTLSNWIWEEMESDAERTSAMNEVLPYLDRFIAILNQTQWDKWVSQKRCNVTLLGSEWGAHQLCTVDQPPSPCHFISFGISNDYSFDTQLAELYHCHGFAGDPTIVHKSALHDLVTFHNVAARTLTIEKEQLKESNQTGKPPWWIVSMPTVKKFLGLDRIAVLKLDCEGCEYSLSRDVLLEEPRFFDSVDQFTFEVHLNRVWLHDTRHLYYYALLFKLLEESGLRVMGTSMGGCGDREKVRSIPEIYKLNYPGAGRQRLRERRSCHEYLFARY